MMTDKVLWAVTTNSDLTEGRGRQFVKHFCELEATALRLAKQGYVQGSDCPVSKVKVLVLDGQHVLPTSLINVEPPTKEDEVVQMRLNKKAIALAKAKEAGLTDEDIAAIRSGA